MRQLFSRAITAYMVIAVLCFSTSAQGQQQQEPSLNDTVSWLTEQLPALGGWAERDISLKIDSVEFQGCNLRYRLTQRSFVGYVWIVSVPLANIDSAAIKVNSKTTEALGAFDAKERSYSHFECILPTKTDRAKTIKVQMPFSRAFMPDSLESKIAIPFSDEVTAQRFAKAFIRVTTLCAAKKEPF